MTYWIYLFIAIISELVATSLLKVNSLHKYSGINQIYLILAIVIFYIFSFYFLGKTIEKIPTSIAYALWSGIGISILVIIDRFIYHNQFTILNYVSLMMIVIGIILLELTTK